jgi:hypothetical protein
MQIDKSGEALGRALLSKLTDEEIKERIGIGFCQQKFWKRSAWDKSMKIMKIVCSLGLAKPFNYGHGKGKYTSDLDISEVVSRVIKFRDGIAA